MWKSTIASQIDLVVKDYLLTAGNGVDPLHLIFQPWLPSNEYSFYTGHPLKRWMSHHFHNSWLETILTAFPLNQSLVRGILVFYACTQYVDKLATQREDISIVFILKTRSMAQCTSGLLHKAITEATRVTPLLRSLFLMLINLFMIIPSFRSLQNRSNMWSIFESVWMGCILHCCRWWFAVGKLFLIDDVGKKLRAGRPLLKVLASKAQSNITKKGRASSWIFLP